MYLQERDLEVIQEELGVARVQLASASRDHSTLSEEMQRRLLQKEVCNSSLEAKVL